MWVKKPGGGIHLDCLNDDEVMQTHIFCQPGSPGSDENCLRCGISLEEVPDP